MPKPKLPAAITVGPYVYRVVLRTSADLKNGKTQNIGECDNDGFEISILRSLRKDKKREVLLHEVLHCCHYLSGRSPEDTMTGEQAVEATVHALLQVLRENPELVYYLIA